MTVETYDLATEAGNSGHPCFNLGHPLIFMVSPRGDGWRRRNGGGDQDAVFLVSGRPVAMKQDSGYR